MYKQRRTVNVTNAAVYWQITTSLRGLLSAKPLKFLTTPRKWRLFLGIFQKILINWYKVARKGELIQLNQIPATLYYSMNGQKRQLKTYITRGYDRKISNLWVASVWISRSVVRTTSIHVCKYHVGRSSFDNTSAAWASLWCVWEKGNLR